MATVLASAIPGTSLFAKLQIAATSSNYPTGTVFDFSATDGGNITSSIEFSRPGQTYIFGRGTITYTATSGNMFQISAPNVTFVGVNRSAKDIDANGTVFSMGGGVNMGYHIFYKVTSTAPGTVNGNCLTLRNLNFKGAQSVYTSSGGTVSYSSYGGGGIFITESNPTAAGMNVNNIIIDNVLLVGARQHGIFLYGAIASKITNTRIRNAAGHGFLIDGESTSVSIDTCYASGCYLAGYALKDASYSSLNNCASDSNGLGYWLRNTTSTTLVSCGAESNVPRSNIPNNLGITLNLVGGGLYTVNDIGADNVNHIKGTSFFISGGEKVTLTAPLSKDPGGNPNAGVFINKRTAHFGFYGGVYGATITTPRISGTTTTKYFYRIEELDGQAASNLHIEDSIGTYDPTNPIESPDGPMLQIADVLDQGSSNIFEFGGEHNIFSAERHYLFNNVDENIRFNALHATERLVIPTYDAHPPTIHNGTIYFNTTENKLYIYNNQWYDTCCTTTPAPDCTFPSGLSQYSGIGNNSAVVIGSNLYSNIYALTGGLLLSTELLSGNYVTSDLSSTVTPGYLIGMSNLVYCSITNCLYWTSYINGSLPYTLIKYDLTTFSQTAAIDLGIVSSGSVRPIVADNKLLVVYPNKIEERDVNTLALLGTYSHTGQSVTSQNSYKVINDRVIIANVFAQSDTFTVFNSTTHAFSTYSISNATATNPATTMYLDSSNNLYIASQNDGLITKFDSAFNELASWTDPLYIINPSGLYINEINGNVIATFGSASVIPSNGAQWTLVAYNLTTNSYIGSSNTILASPWYGPSYMVELNNQTFGIGGSYFYTICTPYAV